MVSRLMGLGLAGQRSQGQRGFGYEARCGCARVGIRPAVDLGGGPPPLTTVEQPMARLGRILCSDTQSMLQSVGERLSTPL